MRRKKLNLALPASWESERLAFRLWREDDAAELFRWASDPEVGPRAGWPPHTSEADSLQVLRSILMDESTWAITEKGSDAPIGSIGVFPTDFSAGKGQPEIGYWLARPFWGRGYMPEAVRTLRGLCFAGGAERVWCAHFIGNDRSRRVIEKCGFRYCETEGYTGADGVWHESRYYAAEREDWE